MGNNITIYSNPQFGKIRTMTDGKGEPWFCGRDVAQALGYANPNDAIVKHVDEEDKLVSQIATPGQRRQFAFINESGLYSLILSSKLDTARQFKRWVTSEVLPAIRKHGAYSMHGSQQTPTSDIECVRRAFIVLNIQVKELSAANDRLSHEVEELTDKAQYCDLCLQSNDCLTMTQVAKSIGMTVLELTHKLLSLGIIYKQSGQYMLYAKYARRGYASTRTQPITYNNGETGTSTYLVWTQRGARFIKEMFSCRQLSLFDNDMLPN